VRVQQSAAGFKLHTLRFGLLGQYGLTVKRSKRCQDCIDRCEDVRLHSSKRRQPYHCQFTL
jgi:hypothetical protein